MRLSELTQSFAQHQHAERKRHNGTAINPDNNVAGLISDVDSGMGIVGIAVTDGYTFVVTDANGVYQMKRNELGKSTTASNYWYCAAPSGNPASESGWEARATQTIPSSVLCHTFRQLRA